MGDFQDGSKLDSALCMNGKMSTMLLFCGEAGSGESSVWLHFEGGVPLLLEGVGTLLPGFHIRTKNWSI